MVLSIVLIAVVVPVENDENDTAKRFHFSTTRKSNLGETLLSLLLLLDYERLSDKLISDQVINVVED